MGSDDVRVGVEIVFEDDHLPARACARGKVIGSAGAEISPWEVLCDKVRRVGRAPSRRQATRDGGLSEVSCALLAIALAALEQASELDLHALEL